jgi:potassium efflux system protein
VAAPTPTEDEEEPFSPEKVKQSQEDIRQKLSTLDSSGLSEEDRKKAAEFYQKALDSLASLEEFRSEKARHATNSSNYDKELDEFQTNLSKLANEAPPLLTGDLVELEQELAKQEQVVQLARENLAKSEKQPKDRQSRLAELPQLVVERQQELEKVEAKLSEVGTKDATDVLANAERNYLTSRAAALKMSLEEMEAQRQYFTKSPDLVQVRRDYRAKYLAQEEKKLAALHEAIDARRLAETEAQANEAARMAAVERPEAIAKLAKENSELAEKQAEIAAKSTALTDELAQVVRERDKRDNEFTQSKERVKAAGLTEASGQQMRQQQDLLPDRRAISRRIALLEREKEDAIYSSFDLIDRRSTIKDMDVDERVAKILEKIPADQRAGAEQEVRELLTAELQILDSAIETYDSYSRQLTKLAAAQDELRITAKEYADFITEHVLWIRSTSFPRLADWEPAVDAVNWTFNRENWHDAIKALWVKSGSSPLAVVLFFVVLGFSLYMHRRLRNRLRAVGIEAEKRTSTDFWPSLEATWITMLMALPWPVFLGFLGWWMDSPLNESEFVRSLSVSLQFTALCLLLLELVRHLCRTKGLADAHFNWPQSCLQQVRQHMRWLIWACLPLVVWLTGLEVQNVEKLWSSSLGRACFVAVMGLMSFAAYRVLLSQQSPFRLLLMNNSETNSPQFFRIWAPVVTALPSLLALLAIAGYYYTAQQLTLRLLQTAAVVLVLLILGGLTRRWILVNRRRLAREQAKQKRAQVAATAAANTASDEAPALQAADIAEDSVDLVALGEQTSKLVLTGLIAAGLVSAWFVWGEMLPALAYFGQEPIFPRPDVENALTWGQLFRFLLVLVVTYVATRNLPALMEFAILQRLPLDSGSRYAITSISRYVLVAIGLSTAYSSLGFTGTSIQWLVAAMGVGLGFGLQEIFANFVSGIILLFERPIRVGDIVTLGDKTGVVSRIRMRATTILDPDRKEYIVPNKDLITERLLNWTLSDSTNRIEIKVGIAYGSDTNLACRMLLEAAGEHPLILKDPEPVATFDGFGASTLDFTLRCFLPNMEKRLVAIHELNTAVNQKFEAAGLEMAYPQMDVYVKRWPDKWPDPQARAVAKGQQQNGNGHDKTSAANGHHGS